MNSGNQSLFKKQKHRWYPHSRNVLFSQIILNRAATQALEIPQLRLHQSLPDLLRNLLRNPLKPDLPLHQSFLEPSPEPSPEPA